MVSQLQGFQVGLNNNTPPPPRPTIDINQLLLALNITNPVAFSNIAEKVVELLGAERDYVFHAGRSLSVQAQSKITAIIQDSRFQAWMSSLSSQVLTIIGMDNNLDMTNVVSPLSYLCAVLTRTSNESQFVHAIAFFCRFHMDPDDPLNGAVGMMQSLITQIVLSLAETNNLNLGFLTETDLETIATLDLAMLCQLFDEILKTMPAGLVVCMIDGANFFGNELHLRAMDCAMQFLNSIVEEVNSCQSGVVFKLLVTSPMGMEYFHLWFPGRVDLTLLGHVPNDHFGFNESMFALPLI